MQRRFLRIWKETGKTILFVRVNINEAVVLADGFRDDAASRAHPRADRAGTERRDGTTMPAWRRW